MDQVDSCIGSGFSEGALRTGEHNRFVVTAKHKAECAGRKGHRVGAVQDNKTIKVIVGFGDGLGDACDPDVDGDNEAAGGHPHDCGADGRCRYTDDSLDNDLDRRVDEAGECMVGERACRWAHDGIDNDLDDRDTEITPIELTVSAICSSRKTKTHGT